MAELGARFGVQRLTESTRRRMADDLNRVGVYADPPLEQAHRTEIVRLVAAGRAARPSSAAAVAAHTPRRWPVFLAGAVGVVLLIAVLSGGGSRKPAHGAGSVRLAAATSAPAPTPTPDPIAAARRRARALADQGRYVVAVAVLDAAGDHGPLWRRFRGRGARVLIADARTALSASHEPQARRYARQARELGAGTAAADVIRTANRQSAVERAQARERRRLAAIARDQQTCTASEKATVDAGATTPSGCAAYAARQATPEPTPTSQCDPSYKGACLDPNASDYDCAGGSGNGPKYVSGPIEVVGDDHFDLDRDGDGVACEDG